MRRLVIKSTSDVLPPKLKGLRDSYGGYTAPPARLPWLRHNTSITSFELEVGRGADNLEHLPVSLESCVLRLGRRFTNDHLSGMSRLSRLTTLLLHGGSDQVGGSGSASYCSLCLAQQSLTPPSSSLMRADVFEPCYCAAHPAQPGHRSRQQGRGGCSLPSQR